MNYINRKITKYQKNFCFCGLYSLILRVITAKEKIIPISCLANAGHLFDNHILRNKENKLKMLKYHQNIF